MRFLINSAEEVIKSPLFRILAIVSVVATVAMVLTDGEPFSSSEVVVWAWAAEFYHLGDMVCEMLGSRHRVDVRGIVVFAKEE